VRGGIEGIEKAKGRSLVEITIPEVRTPIPVKAGGKATARIPVVIGPAYDGDFQLKFDPSPGSDLKVSAQTLKEDDTVLVLTIEAGFNKGLHWIRITPDRGPAQDVRVTVTPE